MDPLNLGLTRRESEELCRAWRRAGLYKDRQRADHLEAQWRDDPCYAPDNFWPQRAPEGRLSTAWVAIIGLTSAIAIFDLLGLTWNWVNGWGFKHLF